MSMINELQRGLWDIIDSKSMLFLQWNLSLTTTSMIKFISCDLLSNVF